MQAAKENESLVLDRPKHGEEDNTTNATHKEDMASIMDMGISNTDRQLGLSISALLQQLSR